MLVLSASALLLTAWSEFIACCTREYNVRYVNSFLGSLPKLLILKINVTQLTLSFSV